MNEYKLTPIDPTDPAWKYSCTTDPVIVEADDEKSARLKALGKFGKAAEAGRLGEDNPQSPWMDPEKVMCEHLGNV